MEEKKETKVALAALQKESRASVLATLINCLTLAKMQRDDMTVGAVRKELKKLVQKLSGCCTKLSVKVSSRNRCQNCKSSVETKRLPECYHDICKDCITIEVNRVAEGGVNSAFNRCQCPKCKETIARESLAIFFSEGELAAFWESATKNRKRVMRTCPICMMEYDVDEEGISLDCDHMFCMACVMAHVESLVKENKVSETELVCPQCSKPISATIVAYLTEKAKCLDKLVKFRLEGAKGIDEYFKNCPSCDFGIFLPLNAREFRCAHCNKTMCPNCNAIPPHPEHETCKQDTGLLGVEGIRYCPKCKAPIERKSGCNFMTCASTICKSKTYFCYLCGFPLQLDQHYSHYKKKGPWGPFCNNTEFDYPLFSLSNDRHFHLMTCSHCLSYGFTLAALCPIVFDAATTGGRRDFQEFIWKRSIIHKQFGAVLVQRTC